MYQVVEHLDMIMHFEILYLYDQKWGKGNLKNFLKACDTLPKEQFNLHNFFPQFLIFQQNNSVQRSVLIFLRLGTIIF